MTVVRRGRYCIWDSLLTGSRSWRADRYNLQLIVANLCIRDGHGQAQVRKHPEYNSG